MISLCSFSLSLSPLGYNLATNYLQPSIATAEVSLNICLNGSSIKHILQITGTRFCYRYLNQEGEQCCFVRRESDNCNSWMEIPTCTICRGLETPTTPKTCRAVNAAVFVWEKKQKLENHKLLGLLFLYMQVLVYESERIPSKRENNCKTVILDFIYFSKHGKILNALQKYSNHP